MTAHKRLLLWLFTLVSSASPLIAQSDKVADLVRKADAAFVDEDRNLARKLYREVVALNPEQSHSVYRLGQLADDDEAALVWFKRYVRLEPGDAWGWIAVGDKDLKLGKVVEARDAFRRAARLAPDAAEVGPRLEKARLRAAPTVEPLGGVTGDSDGNRTWRFGVNADTAIPDSFRFGAGASHSIISDGINTATINDGEFRLQGRPRKSLRLDFNGGAAMLDAPGAGSWTTPILDAHARWNSRGNGGNIDIRGVRSPLGTTPLLVTNHAMRNEFRLSGTVPVGPVRFRAGGRDTEIQTDVENDNRKLQADAALVLPLGWRGEISAQYHWLGFQRISRAGYFAPGGVETVEGGTYWELGGDGRWSAELDLGAGMQRLALQQQAFGAWKPALRAWGSFNVDLTRAISLTTEVEAYSAPFSPVGVSTAPNWRYASVSLGLRFRVF